MARAVINNHPYQFEKGVSILGAARAIGLDIPTLCHDERLKPIGSCRMCLVKVEGKPHPMTACNTSLADGMVISTHTPALENERRMLLKMLAQDHPGEGLREVPEKPFYRYALQYGLTERDFNGSHETKLLDDSHPYTFTLICRNALFVIAAPAFATRFKGSLSGRSLIEDTKHG